MISASIPSSYNLKESRERGGRSHSPFTEESLSEIQDDEIHNVEYAKSAQTGGKQENADNEEESPYIDSVYHEKQTSQDGDDRNQIKLDTIDHRNVVSNMSNF